ncbi:MAG TPA: hypothetical protein VGS27_19210 [Candidatus Sulfotelmatobacter sp.]|nr:hypothetical protein [Candidatus Sulfotelmatobacter sp.]
MRASSLLFRWVFLIAALSIGGWVAFAQAANEHDSVLHALSLSYGPSIDKRHPRFRIAPDHFLVPTFSSDGVLILISIEPRKDHDPTRAFGMSKMEFDSVLATLSSIKPLQGAAEDNGFRERSSWRTHKRVVYGNAYLETAELMGEGDPAPIESAKIYYIRRVTGVPKIGADEKPDGSGNRLVCFDGAHYIASESVFVKLWSNPKERQTVDLAGPTDESCSSD